MTTLFKEDEMKDYKYEDFITNFKGRREFDLIIYGNKYGLSWYGLDKISFAKYGDSDFCQYFESVEQFMNEAKINGHYFYEIWSDVEVDVIY